MGQRSHQAALDTLARDMDTHDPRVARTRATVLGIGADIVVEGGPSSLTVDAVVARSGVARSTIYRHWPTRDDLLIDVFDYCAPTFEQPPAGLDFVDAMRAFLYDVVRQLSDPKWARMMPALLALKSYEVTMAALERRMQDRQGAVIDDLFQRGADEGLFTADLDRDQSVALLVGPLMFAVLTGTTPLTTDLADRSLHAFVSALARVD
jgi:AcrR family transcriptional regulator